MNVSRPHEAAEQHREPVQLHGLPDGDTTQDDDGRDDRHGEVCRLLQRVVLALMWMIPPNESVELDHFPHTAEVAALRCQIAPLAMQVQEGEIHDCVDDEN